MINNNNVIITIIFYCVDNVTLDQKRRIIMAAITVVLRIYAKKHFIIKSVTNSEKTYIEQNS